MGVIDCDLTEYAGQTRADSSSDGATVERDAVGLWGCHVTAWVKTLARRFAISDAAPGQIRAVKALIAAGASYGSPLSWR